MSAVLGSYILFPCKNSVSPLHYVPCYSVANLIEIEDSLTAMLVSLQKTVVLRKRGIK